jgi:hypothetical protein
MYPQSLLSLLLAGAATLVLGKSGDNDWSWDDDSISKFSLDRVWEDDSIVPNKCLHM